MASKPMSINDLPDEILLEILSYIGPEDLCLVIAKVCEKWNFMAKDVVLWKALSYYCDRFSDISHIKEVLTAAPALHSLTLRDRRDAADILQFLFHKHVDLRKLVLKYCNLGENSTDLFANIVALYPDLEGLSLEGCDSLTSAGCCLIPCLKKLSELSFTDCEELSGKTVCLIADSCQHLKKLSLNCVGEMDDADLIHVIKKLGKQLTALVLEGPSYTDVAFLYLSNCARLQELEVLSCENLTDRGLLEGIGKLHDLTSLCLSMCDFLTAQALSTFLHHPSMTSIVFLELTYCSNLDDEGLKGIAERCMHLKKFEVCSCCHITDAGISTVISHCNQLRILNLWVLPNITGEGWLALVPSCLPHLRRLGLMGSDGVCDKYVDELISAVPELDVIK